MQYFKDLLTKHSYLTKGDLSMNTFENFDIATKEGSNISNNIQDIPIYFQNSDLIKRPETASSHLPALEIETTTSTEHTVATDANSDYTLALNDSVRASLISANACRNIADGWNIFFGPHEREARRRDYRESESYLRNSFNESRDRLSTETLREMANYFRTNGSEFVQPGTENRHIPSMVRDENMQTAIRIERYLRTRNR